MNADLFNNLISRLKEINLPEGKYAIFGSGPIAVRGLKVPHDIDIVVMQDVYDEYKTKDEWVEKKCNSDFYLDNDGIELWYNWRPGEWNLEEIIREAEMIDGIPYVRLDKVLEWKKLSGRPKDLEDVKRIEDYLKIEK